MPNYFRANKKSSGGGANLQTKTITAGTSSQTVQPDSGFDGFSEVTVDPTPSQTKSVTATTSQQTVTPDSGKLLNSVTVNPQSHSGTSSTYTSNGTKDLGANHNIRYVSISVPSSAPTFGTAIISTNGTVSLDSSKTYAVSIALYHTSQTTPTSDGPIFYQEYSNINNVRCYMLGVKNATYLSISGNNRIIIATPLN